jgi:hypothetical protein
VEGSGQPPPNTCELTPSGNIDAITTDDVLTKDFDYAGNFIEWIQVPPFPRGNHDNLAQPRLHHGRP